jgi:hypothetical protein
MSDWKNSRSSKIHGHPKKKTNQEKRATDHASFQQCHISSIKIPSPENPRYYHDEDNDTPCYKDLRIDGYKIAAIFIVI